MICLNRSPTIPFPTVPYTMFFITPNYPTPHCLAHVTKLHNTVLRITVISTGQSHRHCCPYLLSCYIYPLFCILHPVSCIRSHSCGGEHVHHQRGHQGVSRLHVRTPRHVHVTYTSMAETENQKLNEYCCFFFYFVITLVIVN